MQIVIDIPDEIIESIENGSFGAKYNIYDLCGFIVNSTLLPKNHGRLIDADALMVYCRNQKSRTIDCNDIARFPTAVPTVLEAESEE